MKIIWIFDKPLIPEAGGTERVTSLITNELQNIGHSCLGILVLDENKNSASYNDNQINDIYSFLKSKQIDIVINQKANDARFLEYFTLIGGGKWRNEGGKIITCLHFNPQPLSDLYNFKSRQKKSIITWLLIMRSYLFSNVAKKKQDCNMADIYGYLYDNSDAFVLLSESHRPYIEKVLVNKNLNKIHCIPNPLTFDSIISEDLLEKKSNIVLVVSRMDEYYKRISIILKAWKHLTLTGKTQNWKLKIVGDGPFLQSYREYKEKHGLYNVTFEGRQKPLPYYQEAKILLMSSISEGLPMTILESFQCGVVPIVMNSCPIFSELIKNNENGLLCKDDDLSQYEKCIETLITDPEKLHKLSLNAIESSNSYIIKNVIKHWERLFEIIYKK